MQQAGDRRKRKAKFAKNPYLCCPQQYMAFFTLLNRLVSSNFFGAKHRFTANVMAPLFIAETEWKDFARMLRIAKRMGVDAVSVDVWWGMVEQTPNKYDWTYYDKVLQHIEQAELQWVPIMSFHECGPNVGDEFKQPIPKWIWEELQQQAVRSGEFLVANAPGITPFDLTPDDFAYKSETGAICRESVALWADEWVLPYYENFMREFHRQYGSKAFMTQEINISCGPAGELRYPSYNVHDGGGFPQIGNLQCYSRLAKEDFRTWAEQTYRHIARLNQRWNTRYSSFDEVEPPTSGHQLFFEWGRSPRQEDFLMWYNGCLVEHGREMLQAAIRAFAGTTFAQLPIGIKMPGIHWQIANPDAPRCAELAAGLVRTADLFSPSGQFGYKRTLDRLIERPLRDRVILHFTCLEMPDTGGEPPAFSKAETLVGWVGQACYNLGINVKGENALSTGIEISTGWDMMENALKKYNYSGLTTLRINQVVEGVAYERYAMLIAEMKGLISNDSSR